MFLNQDWNFKHITIFYFSVLQNVAQDLSIELFCARAVTWARLSRPPIVLMKTNLRPEFAAASGDTHLHDGSWENGVCVLHNVVLASKWGQCNVFHILASHLLSVLKPFDHPQCSSARVNVMLPLSPMQKNAKMWTKWLTAHWCWSSSSAAGRTLDKCAVRPAKDTDPKQALLILSWKTCLPWIQQGTGFDVPQTLPCGNGNHWSASADNNLLLF